MSDETTIERAVFWTDPSQVRNGPFVPVHFNPTSLQYTLTNSLQQQGKSKQQYVTQSTAKLSMDLVFDTTDSGKDVRQDTTKVAKLMEPSPDGKGKGKVPSVVVFEWGTFRFQGFVETYKETIDFFAPAGVPLRATINLSLSRQDKVFDPDKDARQAPPPEPVVRPTTTGDDVTDIASDAGAPDADRAIAAANGLDTMRFPDGPALALDPTISLAGPVAFATGGAGAGADVGVGAGGGIGVGGIGAGGAAGLGGGMTVGGGAAAGTGFSLAGGASFGAAGVGIVANGSFSGSTSTVVGFAASGAVVGASAGSGGVVAVAAVSSSAGVAVSAGAVGGPVFGGLASAGVPASAGAFAGLRASTILPTATATLDTSRLLPTPGSAAVATGGQASFALGGQAVIDGAAGLRADVGTGTSVRDIQFDGF